MRVCVLGVEGSFYTKVMLKKLDEAFIEYDVIYVKTKKKDRFLQKISNLFFKLDRFLYVGKYEALSKKNLYTYKEIYEEYRYLKSKKHKKILSLVEKYKSKCKNIVYSPSVNNVKTYKTIKSNQYDIGIFGGVGIVSKPIIDSFKVGCLNAHPSPLPNFRGGGALEFTLNAKMKPAVSVHFANEDIDGGYLLAKKELDLEKDDSFNHIKYKSKLYGCELLVETLKKLIDKNTIEKKEIIGKVNYWKDCTKNIRLNARRNLKSILKSK